MKKEGVTMKDKQFIEHYEIYKKIAKKTNELGALINEFATLPKTEDENIDNLIILFTSAHEILINAFTAENKTER